MDDNKVDQKASRKAPATSKASTNNSKTPASKAKSTNRRGSKAKSSAKSRPPAKAKASASNKASKPVEVPLAAPPADTDADAPEAAPETVMDSMTPPDATAIAEGHPEDSALGDEAIADASPAEAEPTPPDMQAVFGSRLSEVELFLLNQTNFNDTLQGNTGNLLELINALGSRIYQLELALGAQRDDGSFLPVSDQLNGLRLDERERLVELLGKVRDDTAETVSVVDAKTLSFEEQLEALEARAPKTWKMYKASFDRAADAYSTSPEDRLSLDGHDEAEMFRKFISPYLHGNVLDIGCGPQSKPSYLSHYPSDRIVGIDPLPPSDEHDFQFVRAFGEFLPFDDNSFDVVILGTTLDHYFDLKAGLDEIVGVLKPGGYMLNWISLHDGADPYDAPDSWKGYDDGEHLYHIDLDWLEPMLEARGFKRRELMRFASPFHYGFFAHQLGGSGSL